MDQQVRQRSLNLHINPFSHRLAQFVAFFSLSMVLVSTITFVLATIEELQEDEEGQTDYPVIVAIIHLIDNFVIIFFTIEYILRLLICPVKKKFVKDTMNMVMPFFIKSQSSHQHYHHQIDLLAICPFYINLLLEGLEDFQIIGKVGEHYF